MQNSKFSYNLRASAVNNGKLRVIEVKTTDDSFKTLSSQSLFRSSLSGDKFNLPGGKCGTVLGVDKNGNCVLQMDDGFLFRTESSLSMEEKENILFLDPTGKIIR